MANRLAKGLVAAAAFSVAAAASANANVVFSPGTVLGFNITLNHASSSVTGSLRYDGSAVTYDNVVVAESSPQTVSFYTNSTGTTATPNFIIGGFSFDNAAALAVYAGTGANVGKTIIDLSETVNLGTVYAYDDNSQTYLAYYLEVTYDVFAGVNSPLIYGANAVKTTTYRLGTASNGYEADINLVAVVGGAVTPTATVSDNIKASPTNSIAVPEPVSMTVLGVGLAGLAAVRRRRRS